MLALQACPHVCVLDTWVVAGPSGEACSWLRGLGLNQSQRAACFGLRSFSSSSTITTKRDSQGTQFLLQITFLFFSLPLNSYFLLLSLSSSSSSLQTLLSLHESSMSFALIVCGMLGGTQQAVGTHPSSLPAESQGCV